jgi:hypothetical protein
MGTLVLLACPATATANDEDPDAWGPDFNDDQLVNGLDVFRLALHFGSAAGGGAYSNRVDLNADGSINSLDVFRLAQAFNASCSLA